MDESEKAGTADNEAGEEGAGTPTERSGDPLRSAVERTLSATAGSASETRQRARELLDEVARRGEDAREQLSRRGGAAREEVGRRAEAAREQVTRRGEEAGSRLADAIADLRLADRDDLGILGERLGAIESRLGDLERMLRRETGSKADSNPEAKPETGPGGPDPGA
jgi:polyhydroxyalkanoate synthesis regulator phasin